MCNSWREAYRATFNAVLLAAFPRRNFAGVFAAWNAARNADCSENGSARFRAGWRKYARVLARTARAHYIKRPSGRVYGVTLLSARDNDPRTVPLRKRYADTACGGSRETVHTGCRTFSRSRMYRFGFRGDLSVASLPGISLRLKENVVDLRRAMIVKFTGGRKD